MGPQSDSELFESFDLAPDEISDVDFADATHKLAELSYVVQLLRRSIIRAFINRNCKPLPMLPGVDAKTVLLHARLAESAHATKQGVYFICLTAGVAYAWFFASDYGFETISAALIMVFGVVTAAEGFHAWWTRECRRAARSGGNPLWGIFKQPIANRTEALKLFEPDVVYYSGFHPFVGFGNEINSWTIAVDLTRSPTSASKSPPEIDAADLYGAVRKRLLSLPVDKASYKDKIFVDGRRLRNEVTFLPNAFERPLAVLPQEEITRMKGQSELGARHYACYSIKGWSGQTVITSLFRCVSNREFCVVEKKTYYLAPVNDVALRQQWSFRTVGARRMLPAMITGGLAAPGRIIISPVLFFDALPFLSTNSSPSEKTRRRIKKKDIPYDYGLTETFRESVADEDFHHVEFQLADMLANFKMVDQVIIDALAVFFEAHDVDTADIRQTKQAILSRGVIISGGTLQTKNLAVGKGATVRKVS